MPENAATETVEQETVSPKPSDLPGATKVEPEAEKAEKVEHEQYPEDHPLVKTLAAQKETIRELKGKASKYDEAEAQRLKDEQTWQERAETAEAWRANREKQDERDKLARDVLKGTGFDVGLLDGLDTEEAMRSRVDQLKALKGPTASAAPASLIDNADSTVANQVKQLTRADLQNMTPAQVQAADARGELDELKGIRK